MIRPPRIPARPAGTRRFSLSRARRSAATCLTVCLAIVATAFPLAAQPNIIEVRTVARAMQPGEVLRIDIACDCGDASPRLRVFDTDVTLAPAGSNRWQALVGIDLDVAPGEYPLTVTTAGGRTHTEALRVSAKQFQTRQLRVAPAYVDPPPEIVARILLEAARLEALWTIVTPRGWDGPFQAPLTTRSSNNFGARSVFNGEARNPHAGVDYASPAGTPIAAPGGGRVVLAEDLYFTGRTVIIDHGLGLYSVLAHLSAMTVAANAIVDAGTMVGRVGATGRATGPHLHWGVRLNGARVDPLSLLAATR